MNIKLLIPVLALCSFSTLAADMMSTYTCTGQHKDGEPVTIKVFENERNFCRYNNPNDRNTALLFLGDSETMSGDGLVKTKKSKKTSPLGDTTYSHTHKREGITTVLSITERSDVGIFSTSGSGDDEDNVTLELKCGFDMMDFDC